MIIQLKKTELMPKELQPGILYYSEEYGTAAHLCACGCGSKVRTPIDATEWSLEEDEDGPTLYPSIGNWQKPCRSHYLIRNGKIIWCRSWTEDEVQEGRQLEHERRVAHFDKKKQKKKKSSRLWDRLLQFFRRH